MSSSSSLVAAAASANLNPLRWEKKNNLCSCFCTTQPSTNHLCHIIYLFTRPLPYWTHLNGTTLFFYSHKSNLVGKPKKCFVFSYWFFPTHIASTFGQSHCHNCIGKDDRAKERVNGIRAPQTTCIAHILDLLRFSVKSKEGLMAE